MGIMSKTDRITERPKPPSWQEITKDVQTAKEDDVAFNIGKQNLPTSTAGGPSSTATFSRIGVSSPITSHTTAESELDSFQVDRSSVEASCASALRLMYIYAELKDEPTALQEQYGKLKDLGAEMTQSLKKLKSLSQTIVADSEKSTDILSVKAAGAKPEQETSSAKGKSKKKK